MSIFSKVKISKPKLSKFDLSHERKMSLKMGELVPLLVMDVLPGDRVRCNTEIMLRFAPMLAPIMHRVDVKVEYFMVPNRLVMDEWEPFITGGPEGLSAPVLPYKPINTANVAEGFFNNGTLCDYMGIPTIEVGDPVVTPLNICTLPFRAYHTIYNEYYRDQNVEGPMLLSKNSGLDTTDTTELFSLHKRAWKKDYFTSALPEAQRGAAVTVPIDGEGDVTYMQQSDFMDLDGVPMAANKLVGTGGSIGGMVINKDNAAGLGQQGRVENIDEVSMESVSLSVEALRRSTKIQQWLELAARVGGRYVEQLRGMWSVRPDDARLQRPEYLGGGSTPVTISEVLSSVAGDTSPLGDMGGHGVSYGNQNGFTYTAKEHGYVIGLISILPQPAYQQGIPRHFLRQEKFDFAWPLLAQLGEQPIYDAELYFNRDATDHRSTFGYTPRYAEYKFVPTTVHGEFRDSLAFWHMGRIFDAPPALNATFIQSDPTTRIFAVEDAPENLYCVLRNDLSALRALPYFGTPTL